MTRPIASALLGLGLALTLLAPARPAAAQATVDTTAVRVGLDSLRVRYIAAVLAGNAATVAEMYAETGGFDIFGLPRTRGRPAVLAAFTAAFGQTKYQVLEIKPVGTDARTDSDASELGTYHEFLDRGGKKEHVWGRYLGAFSKGADGLWRIQYVMAFPDSTKPGR